MRNRGLHDALRDYALEAAALLSADLDAGAEIEFALDEEAGGPTVLYRYRPLIERFIGERWLRLRALPAREPAERALGAGAETYLRSRGERGDDAEPALRAMLERLWEDASSFAFPEERFERVFADLEQTLTRLDDSVQLLVPVLGLRLVTERIELGHGLSLRRGEDAEAPSEALWPDALEAPAAPPCAVCVLERALPARGEPPLAEARAIFGALGTALRLLAAGPLRLGPLGWARRSGGAWRPFPAGVSGSARGEPVAIGTEEGDELAALFEAVGRSRHGGAVAWALARFEMGCERSGEVEALTDHLLALDALLDGAADPSRAGLALRIAALCADERERRAVQRRVELAFALERFVVAGGSGEAYVEQVGFDSPRALALEVEEHLRAILRDVLCGYLDTDLRAAADDVLLETSERPEIRVRDLREQARAPAAPPAPRFERDGLDPPAPRFEPDGLDPITRLRAAATRSARSPDELGVTASDDWLAEDELAE